MLPQPAAPRVAAEEEHRCRVVIPLVEGENTAEKILQEAAYYGSLVTDSVLAYHV